jgi:hypothetical protein
VKKVYGLTDDDFVPSDLRFRTENRAVAAEHLLGRVWLIREARPFRIRSWRGIARYYWRIARTNGNARLITVSLLLMGAVWLAGRYRRG